MRTLPKGPDLIESVSEFLRSKEMQSPFHAQVAANALDIAKRELKLRARADAAAIGRLSQLLGSSGTAEELEKLLAANIASGKITVGTPGLLDHLWAGVMAELEIDQPKYATYQRAKREGRHA